ncbi:MAG: hypothetical protein FXF49_05270 [Flexistipes sinusarabici]|uniref:Uncharacterized protein n=1 Tax=Flexistipes sinusarabici TaxID=2352 RepID=A0A5D0MQE0_FLESI|nr:hypothetical protein [Flexistipes sinusarabici]TYB33598.1 MAG: hypothetical protein FXF49_05270 [Flexistipes sinusarabici]
MPDNNFLFAILLIAVLLLLYYIFVIRRKDDMDELSGKHFLKGFGFLAENNIAKALNEFSSVIIENNDNLEIYASLGSLFRKNGDYAKAVHIHESTLSNSKLTKSLRKYVLFELVKDYKAWGQFDNAKYYLEELIKTDKSPILAKFFAEIYFMQENYAEAEKFFHKYEKNSGKDYSDWRAYCIVKTAQKEENVKQKTKLLEKALKIHPSLRIGQMELIDSYFEAGHTEKGLSAVNEFIEKDMTSSYEDLVKMRGYYYDYSDVKSFDELIMKKVSSKSENPFYTVFLSDYFIKKDDPEKAREVIRDFVEEHKPYKAILKRYSRIKLDKVLINTFINEPEYICEKCRTSYNDYYTVCANCKSLETINPL